MNLAARLDALERSVLAFAYLEFGDLPGHIFHGNQWGDGSGGGATRDNLVTSRALLKEKEGINIVRAVPVRALVEAKKGYIERKGLIPEHVDFQNITRNEQVTQGVASAFANAPKVDNSPETQAAYAAFKQETNDQWHLLTDPPPAGAGIKVTVMEKDPYPDPGPQGYRAMMEDLRNGQMKVMATGEHPALSAQEYTQFRAVHDAFGHGTAGRGFDRHSEEAAWVSHMLMYTPEASKALTTETRGQNTYLTVNHQVGEYKMALMPPHTWDTSTVELVVRFLLMLMADSWHDSNEHVCAVSHHISYPLG